MAACDRYQKHVSTVSGYTPQNPFGSFATESDYDEWRSAASTMLDVVQANLDRWIDNKPASEDTGTPDALELAMQRKAQLNVAFVGLPAAYLPLGIPNPLLNESDIQNAIKVAQDAACMLGELEDAMRADGMGEHIAIPFKGQGATGSGTSSAGKGAKGSGKGVGLVLVVAAIAAGYAWGNR